MIYAIAKWLSKPIGDLLADIFTGALLIILITIVLYFLSMAIYAVPIFFMWIGIIIATFITLRFLAKRYVKNWSRPKRT